MIVVQENLRRVKKVRNLAPGHQFVPPPPGLVLLGDLTEMSVLSAPPWIRSNRAYQTNRAYRASRANGTTGAYRASRTNRARIGHAGCRTGHTARIGHTAQTCDKVQTHTQRIMYAHNTIRTRAPHTHGQIGHLGHMGHKGIVGQSGQMHHNARNGHTAQGGQTVEIGHTHTYRARVNTPDNHDTPTMSTRT